jgi:hypothetical protein
MGSSGSKNKGNNRSSTTHNPTSTTNPTYTTPTTTNTSKTNTSTTTNTTVTTTTSQPPKKAATNELEQLFEKYQKLDDHSEESGDKADYIGVCYFIE